MSENAQKREEIIRKIKSSEISYSDEDKTVKQMDWGDYPELAKAEEYYRLGTHAKANYDSESQAIYERGHSGAISDSKLKTAIKYYLKAIPVFESYVKKFHECANDKLSESYPRQTDSDSKIAHAIWLYCKAIKFRIMLNRDVYWVLEQAEATLRLKIKPGKLDSDNEADSRKQMRVKNLARLYYDRGNAKYLLGKYDEAIDDYAEVSEIYPERLTHKLNTSLSLALFNKGRAHKALGDDANAKAAWYEAREWCRFKQEYLEGNAYSGIFRYEDAVKCYTESILADRIADAYFNRGVARLKLNDQQGRDDIEEAINRDSKLADSDQNKFLD